MGKSFKPVLTQVAVFTGIAILLSACLFSPDREKFRLRMASSVDLPITEVTSNSTGKVPPEVRNLSQYAFMSAAAYVPNPNPEAMCTIGSNWKQRWKKVPGYNHEELFPPTPARRVKIPGLGYQMWERQGRSGRRQFALVFRGTDASEFGDWYSNARWITRLDWRSWDQYQQTRDLVDILKVKMVDDFGNDFEIVTAGHSLGGGLAQQAAYTWDRIRLAYAFATSPVTGSTSIDTSVTPEARKGLKIFRVYEAGEVLATPRLLARSVVRLQQMDPKITEVRFNFRSTFAARGNGGGLIRQHSIEQLGCDILCRVEKGRSIDQCGTQPI